MGGGEQEGMWGTVAGQGVGFQGDAKGQARARVLGSCLPAPAVLSAGLGLADYDTGMPLPLPSWGVLTSR